MRLLSALLILLMLSGCPLFLERKFPNTPDDLMIIPPAELKQIPHGSSASTILDAAMENNSTYFISILYHTRNS